MLLSYISGIIAVLLWSVLPVLVKSSFLEIPVSYFLVLRFSISLVLFIWFLPQILRKLLQVKLSYNILFAAILGANYFLQSLAIKNMPVSWYIVIFSLNPLISCLLLRIKFNKNLILSFILSILGVCLFLFTDIKTLQSISLSSFVFLVAGMFLWVFYTLMAKEYQKSMSDFEIMNASNIYSLFSAMLVWSFFNFPTVPVTTLSSGSLIALFLSSVGLPVAYFLYLYSLRRTPTFSQLSQYLELIFGLIFSICIFNEKISLHQLFGSFLIIVALVINGISKEKTEGSSLT